jgi:excisionase family DNA binding protein
VNFNDAMKARISGELVRKPEPKPVPVLMTPGEVAKIFRVDPKTVTRWATAGKLRFTRTPGGHVRFYKDEIMEMAEGTGNAG